jgi:tRNA pseudouridine38-40 synthase
MASPGCLVTKLTLEYDGSQFAGWAKQPGLRTVQAVVEEALVQVLGDRDAVGAPLALSVAGRTDKGVHAWGQVASYRHEAVDPVRLNTLLPDDVAIRTAEPQSGGFDARKDATSRTYCYSVVTARARVVRARARALWCPSPLHTSALDQCAQALIGEHDFTAFTPTDSDHVRFKRRVLRAEWRRQEDMLEFWIEADTFMRHMNRALVGTMLEVGAQRRSVEGFQALLQGRPRAEAGPTAPAHGLALASVAY